MYNSAISDFTTAIALNPKNARGYCNRGLAQTKMGQLNQAISDYSKALDLNPMDADAYFDRGTAYYYKGQYDQACSDWKRACELGLCANYDWAERNGVCQ
jgi:tetratricopeptide (TPR) repeat protein